MPTTSTPCALTWRTKPPCWRARTRHEINLRSDIHNAVGITLDETTTREDVLTLFSVLLGDAHGLDIDALDKEVALDSRSIPDGMLRNDAILTHPVFNRYHSETEMMRYMHSLERKDLALNQAMIPLGSCTMKLNAAAEMIPITWPEFSELHPFCPPEQAEGYHQMINQLSEWLVKLTGYDALCMQPNSGAQGEYAGLLAIRHYHESRNEGPSRYLPDPKLRPRHQPGLCPDGGHGGGGRGLR